MENQSVCFTNANVISPCNHTIAEFVSARKWGNQPLVYLQNPDIHIQKGTVSAKSHGSNYFSCVYS